MARVAPRRTWAVHEACAASRHSDAYTWGEVFRVWAFGHALKCAGLSEGNPRHYAVIERYRREAGVPSPR